jgi:AraC-like DNA-binding protein
VSLRFGRDEIHCKRLSELDNCNVDGNPLLEACAAILEHPLECVLAMEDPRSPAQGFLAAVTRLVYCVEGRLGLTLPGPGAPLAVELQPGGCAVVLPDRWFQHENSPDCRLLNLSLREEGLVCRVRARFAGHWTENHAALCRPKHCPAIIGQAIRLCSSLAAGPAPDLRAISHASRCVVSVVLAECRRGLPLDPSAASHSRLRWQEVLEHIQAHVDQDLGRDQVARALGMHPNHLSRLCRAHGLRFVDLVNRQRVAAACPLLVRGGVSVQDVSAACGFSSAQYFCRVFRRFQGCTPRGWGPARHGEA